MLSGAVVQGFGLESRRVHREKSYFVVATGTGSLIVRKSLDARNCIEFAHAIKEHLAENGFKHTDRFLLSRDGKPFVEHEGDVYVCTELHQLREACFADPEDVLAVVSQVGLMHKLAEGFAAPRRINDISKMDDDIVWAVRRDISDMVAIKKKIGLNGGLSDFDVIFIKNYNFYLGVMEEVLQEITATSINEYVQHAKAEGNIVHNRLKEETLLLGNGEVYIENFTGSRPGYCIFDLTALISRYIGENLGDALPVFALLEQYDKKRSLRLEDIRIVMSLLRYPFKFIRLCRSHYSKRRTWTPSSILGKMHEIINMQENYYRQV